MENMEGERRGKFPLMCVLLAVGIANMAFSESVELGDQKNYYPPEPHVTSPPSHSHRHVISPPSHTVSRPRHSHRTPSNCSPPPPRSESRCPPCRGQGTPTPSHGGGSGGYYNSPPSVPITPPSPTLTPITPTPPSPTLTPITPTPPSPTLTPITPIPATPVTPTPTTPFAPTPLVPIISTPPSPPFLPVDPNSPPFTPGIIPGTPIYWSMNPGFVWGIFGYWATIGGLFGPTTTLPFGRNLSVQEALANTRGDSIGELYRQGTAAFLNSMVNKKFPFSTQQVRHGFASAVASEKMAAEQARLFKLANEGHLKKH